jgi:hypothetical protein
MASAFEELVLDEEEYNKFMYLVNEYIKYEPSYSKEDTYNEYEYEKYVHDSLKRRQLVQNKLKQFNSDGLVGTLIKTLFQKEQYVIIKIILCEGFSHRHENISTDYDMRNIIADCYHKYYAIDDIVNYNNLGTMIYDYLVSDEEKTKFISKFMDCVNPDSILILSLSMKFSSIRRYKNNHKIRRKAITNNNYIYNSLIMLLNSKCDDKKKQYIYEIILEYWIFDGEYKKNIDGCLNYIRRKKIVMWRKSTDAKKKTGVHIHDGKVDIGRIIEKIE